jgi:hypothetical protein
LARTTQRPQTAFAASACRAAGAQGNETAGKEPALILSIEQNNYFND